MTPDIEINQKTQLCAGYLTTALTYGELAFSCAFGDESIEVTTKKEGRLIFNPHQSLGYTL